MGESKLMATEGQVAEGRWSDGVRLRAAGEIYMGDQGAQDKGRGIGCGRLVAKGRSECVACPGARDERAPSGGRDVRRGARETPLVFAWYPPGLAPWLFNPQWGDPPTLGW